MLPVRTLIRPAAVLALVVATGASLLPAAAQDEPATTATTTAAPVTATPSPSPSSPSPSGTGGSSPTQPDGSVTEAAALPEGAREAIEARWVELGGAKGPLGDPVADAYPVGEGAAQDFAGGAIYWVGSHGAHEVLPPHLAAYRDLGGPAGTLGWPRSAPVVTDDGTGRWQSFEGGRLYTVPGGERAVPLRGDVLNAFVRAGGTVAMGLPLEALERVTSSITQQRFERGRVVRTSTYGAHAVRAPMIDRYLALGGPTGALGVPVADARASSVAGASEQAFRSGRLYASAATGTWSVRAPHLDKYLAEKGPASNLGLPVGSVQSFSDGTRVPMQNGWLTRRTSTGRAHIEARFAYSSTTPTAADLPYTYRSGCPVGPSSLRKVRLAHYDWARDVRFGTVVVRSTEVGDVVRAFRAAHSARFPVRRVRPADAYYGNDVRSMEADNTSAFNCRKVTGNPYRLSQHSYGNAIDINPFENPYVTSSQVYPEGSDSYLDRSRRRPGMLFSWSGMIQSLKADGWYWGARWSNPDYQHLSSNGG